MSLILFALALAVLVAAGFWVTWRMIGGDTGRHAGHETFDWQEDRPLFRGRPDPLDQLAARYYMPERALDDLYRVDRLLADIDAILRPAAAR